jgi:hypothetical protein
MSENIDQGFIHFGFGCYGFGHFDFGQFVFRTFFSLRRFFSFEIELSDRNSATHLIQQVCHKNPSFPSDMMNAVMVELGGTFFLGFTQPRRKKYISRNVRQTAFLAWLAPP